MKTKSEIIEEYELMKKKAMNPEAHNAGIWARALAWVLEIKESQ